MSDRTKLEITGMEKDNRPKLEPVLFDSQDDIDRRREQLIPEIEGKIQQKTIFTQLFSLAWKVK
ncbi:MAG: hypothetical protein HY694_04805 [Deltaproteobacteria bacterium]|nr:hypothetical protein [Deltaproteobacteria bacterium]